MPGCHVVVWLLAVGAMLGAEDRAAKMYGEHALPTVFI